MAYCTVEDVSAMFDDSILAGLTDEKGTGQIDESLITNAIVLADAEINAFLTKRYTVPLSDPPENFKRLSADIAVYRLYVGRMVTRMTDAVRAMYEDAVKTLKMYADGTLSIGTVVPDNSSYTAVNKTSEDRVFSSSVMDTF